MAGMLLSLLLERWIELHALRMYNNYTLYIQLSSLIRSGMTIDYYVAEGSGIPFRMTITGQNLDLTMDIQSTNMPWVEAL